MILFVGLFVVVVVDRSCLCVNGCVSVLAINKRVGSVCACVSAVVCSMLLRWSVECGV